MSYRSTAAVAGVVWGAVGWVWAAEPSFSEWPTRQRVEVPAAGVARIELAPELLDVLRPGLEDLRLVNGAGLELPYLVERPAPQPRRVRPVKSLQPTLRDSRTLLLLETGTGQAIDAVTLQTPASGFIKAAQLEGSRDGREFETLRQGVPLFRQREASGLTVRFPAGAWPWLRVTVDDSGRTPTPFTGAEVHEATGVDAPALPVTTSLRARDEVDGDTRVVLELGAANLMVAALEVETPEPVFSREVEVRMPDLAGQEIREVEVARGRIYSIDTGTGQPARHLKIAVERLVPARELVLLVKNLDSPPLALSAVRVTRRPVRVLFQPRETGLHYLLAGHPLCAAPRYDLAVFADQLRSVSVAPLTAGMLESNPVYRVSQVLPGLDELAGTIDVAGWRFRKALQLARPGAQQLELDLDVLAEARSDLSDLRLAREGRQLPYLVERSSLKRAVQPDTVKERDDKRPTLSRWRMTLPRAQLPVLRLECRAVTPLFQRSMRLWENVPDGRGGLLPRELGRADWQRTLGSPEGVLSLTLQGRPRSDTLFLETDDGDNPALELGQFRFFYPVWRVVFKASEAPVLYYGHASVPAPRYDLSLVAPRLLGAQKAVVSAGAEELMQPGRWVEGERLTGLGRGLFWGVLALVVVGLLVIIARLLPKT